MDVRDLLRRYLEQRRDLGETELVLDSLSVEEALAQYAVVVELGFDGRGHLVEHETHAGNDERVDDQHGAGAVRRPPVLNARVPVSI